MDEQIEAINVFARVGTSEQKNAIVAKAKNRDANVAVRVAAVENIDWREHVDVVTDLIRSEPELGEATLYMGADKELPPEVVNRMAETAAPVADNGVATGGEDPPAAEEPRADEERPAEEEPPADDGAGEAS